MDRKIKISSLVIAKNEETNIGRCIESQLGCIDEIIVLIDEETSDRTEDIVKSYGKVICRKVKWEGYALTKQKGLSLASNDWIFWIDADEAVTPRLSAELNRRKGEGLGYAAYDVARRAYFLGRWIRHSGWYPSRVVRLFNRKSAGFAERDVHEHLDVKGEIGSLENDLEHYTDPDISHYFKKFNRYTTLAAEELHRKGKKAGFTDIFFRPLFLFFKMYIFRLGFLDGFHGFLLAVFSSVYVFVKYCKLWEKSIIKRSIR